MLGCRYCTRGRLPKRVAQAKSGRVDQWPGLTPPRCNHRQRKSSENERKLMKSSPVCHVQSSGPCVRGVPYANHKQLRHSVACRCPARGPLLCEPPDDYISLGPRHDLCTKKGTTCAGNHLTTLRYRAEKPVCEYCDKGSDDVHENNGHDHFRRVMRVVLGPNGYYRSRHKSNACCGNRDKVRASLGIFRPRCDASSSIALARGVAR